GGGVQGRTAENRGIVPEDRERQARDQLVTTQEVLAGLRIEPRHEDRRRRAAPDPHEHRLPGLAGGAPPNPSRTEVTTVSAKPWAILSMATISRSKDPCAS